MSRSVDLFVDSTLPLEALAELLAARSELRFDPAGDDPEHCRAHLGEVSVELYAHDYVDDGELWLSRYRYVLSSRTDGGVVPLDSAEVTALRRLAHQLHDPTDLPVMLVLDLQYRLPPGRLPSEPTPSEGVGA